MELGISGTRGLARDEQPIEHEWLNIEAHAT